MPIYDYLCSNCGVRTEVIHGIDAQGPRFCPACGAENTLRKAFAPPAVHFKGSGWAKKDRSSSTTKARAKSDSDASTKSGTSGETSTSGGAASTSTGGSTGSGSGSTSGSNAGASSSSDSGKA